MSNITEKAKTLGTKVKNSIKDGASNFVSTVKEDPIGFVVAAGGLVCMGVWMIMVNKTYNENAALKRSNYKLSRYVAKTGSMVTDKVYAYSAKEDKLITIEADKTKHSRKCPTCLDYIPYMDHAMDEMQVGETKEIDSLIIKASNAETSQLKVNGGKWDFIEDDEE